MQPKYTLRGETHDVTPVRRADQITLQIDGHQLDVRLQWIDKFHGEITINGSPHPFYAAQNGNALFIHFDGRAWQLDAHDEFSDAVEGRTSGGHVKAPMPGIVVDVYVAEGDEVEEGVTLMLIESMKLQTEVKATIAGIIKTVGVDSGGSFDKGFILAEIDPVETQED